MGSASKAYGKFELMIQKTGRYVLKMDDSDSMGNHKRYFIEKKTGITIDKPQRIIII